MIDEARHAMAMITNQMERIEKVLAASEEAPTRIAAARKMVEQVKVNADKLDSAIEAIHADRVLLFGKLWRDTREGLI